TWSGEGTGSPLGLIRLKAGVLLRSEEGAPTCVTIDLQGHAPPGIYCGVIEDAAIEGITLTNGSGSAMEIDSASVRGADCVIENSGTVGGEAVDCHSHGGGGFGGPHPAPVPPTTFQHCRFLNNNPANSTISSGDISLHLDGCVFEGNSAVAAIA